VGTVLHAQGTQPHPDASTYEVQGSLGDIKIGADYLVHSVPASSGYVIANDYLIVEAALFGPKFSAIKLSPTDFQLRINDAKTTVESIEASAVAYAVRDGDRGFAGPQRAPGDPNRPQQRNPPTQVPTSINNSGIDRDAPPSVDQQIRAAALPMGDQKVPVSGALFFPFKGKTASIKSLELVYKGPAGELTLKFF
jgi:hypothetical protein